MGYFLLFEGMLSSYIDARKKYLRPGGAMYPNTAEIFVVGIDDKGNIGTDKVAYKFNYFDYLAFCCSQV